MNDLLVSCIPVPIIQLHFRGLENYSKRDLKQLLMFLFSSAAYSKVLSDDPKEVIRDNNLGVVQLCICVTGTLGLGIEIENLKLDFCIEGARLQLICNHTIGAAALCPEALKGQFLCCTGVHIEQKL